jgi:hypothetical protein
MKLLSGEYSDGDTIAIDARGDEFVFGTSEVLRV